MVARPGVGPDHTAPPNSSGITVIVVGLGLGGLAAAIECHRKGHRVLAFDQVPELKPAGACVDGSLLLTFSDIRGPELIMFLGCIGDSIAIGSNAAKTVAKWGNGIVHDRLQPVLSQLETMDFYDGNGELIVKGGLWGYKRGLGYPAHRGDLAMMFYQHACELGIEFHFGCRVTEYWENDTEAGIIVNNEKFTADCVLGADGIHSKARGPVTSQDARPHSSGYAIYRAWFSADLLNSDPKTRWLPDLAKEQGHDLMQVYVGDDIHCVLSTAKMGKDINWTCMHQDIYDVTESWSTPGHVEDMLKYIKHWNCYQKIADIVTKTPKDKLIDFKMLWRDPLSTWTSPKGRMMLIGDAAHPFFPTSGQGAGMAIEDAATVAIALELAGKEDIPLALKATQLMRYDRAGLCQKMGVEMRDAWQKTPWEKLKKDSTSLQLPRANWLFNHDPQVYAYEEFSRAAHAVKTGTAYHAKNIPEGGLAAIRTDDFDTEIKQLDITREKQLAIVTEQILVE